MTWRATMAVLAAGAVVLGLVGCGPSRQDESARAATVSQQMQTALREIPGVTKANVSYVPAHDLTGPGTGGTVECPSCDHDGLIRVMNEALPKLAKLTPESKDRPSVSVTVGRSVNYDDPDQIRPDAVGLPVIPKLDEVKRHYGI